MQCNARIGRSRPSFVRSSDEMQQNHKGHTRKVPYRVVYNWNKGGRLKELRIRHLARKFLKIWIQNIFGRILPHKAKCHYQRVILRQVFEGWRDEWWRSRREWSLTIRAECHNRYYLYKLTFQHWQMFISLQKEKKSKVKNAQSFADKQRLHLVVERWKVFTEMRRINNRMLESALELKRLKTLHSVWQLWQTKLQQHQDLHTLEKLVLKQRAITLQRRTLLQWKEVHQAASFQKERESKASDDFILTLKRKTLHSWKSYVFCVQTKKNSQALAQHVCHLQRMRTFWNKWRSSLRHKRREMTQKYWKMWQDRLEEAEDKSFQPPREMSLTKHRKVLLVWRDNAALQREARLLEKQAHNHFQHILQLKVFQAWREATTCAVSARRQQGETFIRAQTSIDQVPLMWSFRKCRKEARTERIYMEKARRHHESKVLSKAMKAWHEHYNQYHKNKAMKRQGIFLLRLKMYQTYFELWKAKLQQRRREAEQAERALWHWSLTLQAKVLYEWKQWVTDQRKKREQAVQTAQVYRDQLLREGVTCILTYAAHMNDLTATLTQHSKEQRPRRLHGVVKSCALRWKQRALCKPRREQKAKEELQKKKNVTFSCTTPGLTNVLPSDLVKQMDEDEELRIMLANCSCRPQPRRCEDLECPLTINVQKESVVTGAKEAPSCLHPVPSMHHSHLSSSPQEIQDVLLPPAAFMTSKSDDMMRKTNNSDIGDNFQQLSAFPDVQLTETGRETAVMDPASSLMNELLSIQQDMKTYQQDRKQLRTWQKLKGVLQSWLQTSGEDDQVEKNAVCQELKELEERIDTLSTEVSNRKPMMLLHTERIQHLQTVLSNHFMLTALQ